MTLNQIAERICSITNQTNNHRLKERIKDVAKGLFANRMVQIIQQIGINEMFKLSFIIELEEKMKHELYPSPLTNTNKVLASINKLPIRINFSNDAPFTSVSTVTGINCKYLNTDNQQRFSSLLFPNGGLYEYSIINNYLVLYHRNNNNEVEYEDINELIVESIWENPEEVLTYYSDTNDGQNVELPLPSSIIENIIQEILKTEFGIISEDSDTPVNKKVYNTK
jgi:hypothetical protein